MRRELPTRHGRAADALIATYLRELLAEDELSALAAEPDADPQQQLPPAALDNATADAVGADAAI